jgi:peptidoglycan/xylan/chitin deacetylase (PgdA/CDA1 family)
LAVLSRLLIAAVALIAWTVTDTDAAAVGAHPVVVSLTFDDGLESQWAARPILRAHGMAATFYINSVHVGADERLSVQQIRDLAADGHEIGGHTSDHVNLTTLDPAEQQRQICDDRVALSRLFGRTAITSFADPYGASTAAVERVVAGCGYSSARIVGGLNPLSEGCARCPFAESTPPENPFRTRSSISFVTSTPIAHAQQQILGALRSGGGWVPLVFHDVCNGCSDLAIAPADFDDLLDWLAATDGVVVRTVHQVVGGPPRALVTGAEAPNREGRLVNASLEIAGSPDGIFSGLEASYCWRRAGYGDNVARWKRVRRAHSGTWAEQVELRSLATGDQKLMTRTDTGSCSPGVSEGRRYTLGAWYMADVPTQMVAYIQGTDGKWRYWTTSPAATASADWRELVWTTPPVPADGTRISFGLRLAQAGVLTVDDYSMRRASSSRLSTTTALLGGLLAVMLLPVVGFAAIRMLGGRLPRRCGRVSLRSSG